MRVANDEPAKERYAWQGLDIAVETEGGGVRHQDTERAVRVPDDLVGYGYFEGLPAEDGDSLDVILGPAFTETWTGPVFLAAQLEPDGGDFLQWKVLLGFDSEDRAKQAFGALWPAKMFGGMWKVPLAGFLEKVLDQIVVDEPAAGAPDDVDASPPSPPTAAVAEGSMPSESFEVAAAGRPKVCSHCGAELEGADVFGGGDRWFHRPCVAKGPIRAFSGDQTRVWKPGEKVLHSSGAHAEVLERKDAGGGLTAYLIRFTDGPREGEQVAATPSALKPASGRWDMARAAETLPRSQYKEIVHKALRARLLGELEGAEVYKVDGEWVRDNLDVHFVAGASSETAGYVPEGEVWVEDALADKDVAATIVGLVASLRGEDADALITEFRTAYEDGHTPFKAAEKFLCTPRSALAEDETTGFVPTPEELEGERREFAVARAAGVDIVPFARLGIGELFFSMSAPKKEVLKKVEPSMYENKDGRRGPLEPNALVMRFHDPRAIEVTAADLGTSGLQLRRKGYQRYVADHVGEDGESHKVWIGGDHKVEKGSYDGNKRQRRKMLWIIKVDGKEIGDAGTLREAKELAESHLGIVKPVERPAIELAAPSSMPGAPDPLAILKDPSLIEVTARDLDAPPEPIFEDELGPAEWMGHPAPTMDTPPVDPTYDPRIHSAPSFEFVKPPPSPGGPLPALQPAPGVSPEEETAFAETKQLREKERISPEAFHRTFKQFKLKPNGGYQNIANIMKLATPEELEFYGKWYDHAHEDVVEMAARYGKSVPVVAGIVAALSPNMPWDKNLELAERVLQGQPRSSAWPINLQKAQHILKYEDLSELTRGEWGPKVGPFFESIASPRETRRRIVIDGHAANIWRGSYKQLSSTTNAEGNSIKGVSVSDRQRAEMQNDYKRAGDAFGVTPQAAQAISWMIWREVIERNQKAEQAKKRQLEKKQRGKAVAAELVDDGFPLYVPESALAGLAPIAVMRLVAFHDWAILDEEPAVIEVTAADLRVAITPRDKNLPPEWHDTPAPEPKRDPTLLQPPGKKRLKPGEIRLKPDGGYQNIMKVLGLATPAEREYWGKWYPFAASIVSEMAGRYGLPVERVAGVVAVLSPGNKWHQNVATAKQVIEFWKAQREYGQFSSPALSGVGGPQLAPPGAPQLAPAPEPDLELEEDEEELESAASLERAAAERYDFKPKRKQDPDADHTEFAERGPRTHPLGLHGPHPSGYPRNIQKAMEILNGADPSTVVTGPKVTVFFQSLLDPSFVENELVLDGHAINLWKGMKRPLKGIPQPAGAERDRMLKDYQRAADASGLSVQAVQAITWFIWKSVKNAPAETSREEMQQADPAFGVAPLVEEQEFSQAGTMELGATAAVAARDGGGMLTWREAEELYRTAPDTLVRNGLDRRPIRDFFCTPEEAAAMHAYDRAMAMKSRELAARMRAEDTAGEKVGVFLRIPESLARMWPADGRAGEDDSPPHFTMLFIGSVDESRHEELVDIVDRVASAAGPIPVELAKGVDWFENHKGQSIAHKSVHPKSLERLTTLHEALKSAVKGAGFEVEHKEPFICHATLAYLPERKYAGTVPEGGFTARQLEIWGWPTDDVVALTPAQKAARAERVWQIEIPLGLEVSIEDLDVGVRTAKRRRKEKRRRFSGETYYLKKGSTIASTTADAVGGEGEEIRLESTARILREGAREYLELTHKNEGELNFEDLAAVARAAGYDAVRIGSGLIILNENAVAERKPMTVRPGWHRMQTVEAV